MRLRVSGVGSDGVGVEFLEGVFDEGLRQLVHVREIARPCCHLLVRNGRLYLSAF